MTKLRIDHNVLETIKLEKGISSDRQLAARLGISHPYITQMKNGSRGVGLAFVTAMLTELDVPYTFTEGGLYWQEEE